MSSAKNTNSLSSSLIISSSIHVGILQCIWWIKQEGQRFKNSGHRRGIECSEFRNRSSSSHVDLNKELTKAPRTSHLGQVVRANMDQPMTMVTPIELVVSTDIGSLSWSAQSHDLVSFEYTLTTKSFLFGIASFLKNSDEIETYDQRNLLF